jgi:adenine-specific DNA-methyltransferase
MGTKRHMVHSVRDQILDLYTDGRVVDLFSGMGSVAESLSDSETPVVTNDALEFTACFSRAKFTGARRVDEREAVVKRLRARFVATRSSIRKDFSEALEKEHRALVGDRSSLMKYMERAPHFANSVGARRRAQAAHEASGVAHYRLASLYFSAGYLSLAQAVEVDALRYAIDCDAEPSSRDWLVASWLAAVAVLLNAPGHTAQFLKPNSDAAHERLARTWRRSVWDEFAEALQRTDQVGTAAWRGSNQVVVSDALDLVQSGRVDRIGVVYADPPYTKDQYSRFYHLYETLYRYDYPDASGAGRARSDRFSTGFSLKSSVRASFHDLCRHVARTKVPLVVSYPTGGLLEQAGVTFPEIAQQYFRSIDSTALEAKHSTMGASSGSSKKTATENLYVCTGYR